MKISVDALSDTVKRILEDYGEEAEKAVEKTAKKVAKQAKKELKATSPSDSGEYAKGWSYRVQQNRMYTNMVIHNAKKPGLTHLLENGHATRNGTGRKYPDTPAHPHIEKVEQKAQLDFIDGIESEWGF